MFDIKTENYTMSESLMKCQAGRYAIRYLPPTVLRLLLPYRFVQVVLRKHHGYQGGWNGLQECYRSSDYADQDQDNAVYYDAVALYSTKRDEFQAKIFATIEANFKERGLIARQLLVRILLFPHQ